VQQPSSAPVSNGAAAGDDAAAPMWLQGAAQPVQGLEVARVVLAERTAAVAVMQGGDLAQGGEMVTGLDYTLVVGVVQVCRNASSTIFWMRRSIAACCL
jgi:hypothetical protein